MKYRTDLLLAAMAMPVASGTKTIDIEITKPISRIEVTYKTTRTTNVMAAGAPANIPKIELVEGSIPLHSLCGYTSQALAYYSRGNVAMEHGQHISTQSEVDVYAMDFGRFLHDPLLAFDPTRHVNPQLKISWNRVLSDAGVTEDSMEVWAEIFDEKVISPMGFLSAREIWAGNFLANNSVNEILLPADETIRQILVRANREGYTPWHCIDIAKFEEAGTGKVIFDYADLEMYYRRMKSRWPMLRIPLCVATDEDGNIYYLAPTDYNASFSGVGMNGANAPYLGAVSMQGGEANIIGTSGVNITGEVRGYLPWHTFQFPMGKQDDLDDWFDPTGKKPRLRLTSAGGGADGDGNVVIETIHKY